jgi:Fic family protein
MALFFNWLNSPYEGSAYIRAAIAKFWIVTIHPFYDDNGRLSRVIEIQKRKRSNELNY